jgi:hypothetical protein
MGIKSKFPSEGANDRPAPAHLGPMSKCSQARRDKKLLRTQSRNRILFCRRANVGRVSTLATWLMIGR